MFIHSMLDRRKPTPLYLQLKEDLKRAIDEGIYKEGDQLPPEKKLIMDYRVSDITVKRAMKELAVEGILYRQQGKGTFVAEKKIHYPLFRLTNFVEQIQSQGHHPHTKILRFERIEPEREVAERLHLQKGKNVMFLERLRFSDESPIVYQLSYIIMEIGRDLRSESLEERSLYETIQKVHGIKISKVREELRPILLSPFEAKILTIRKGAPAFFSSRITFNDRGIPIIYDKVYVRGDRIILDTEVTSSEMGG